MSIVIAVVDGKDLIVGSDKRIYPNGSFEDNF